MGILLTRAEVAELTGYSLGKFQVKWLHERGWRFELNRLGHPKIDREYYRGRMGNSAPAAGEENTPNWAAL